MKMADSDQNQNLSEKPGRARSSKKRPKRKEQETSDREMPIENTEDTLSKPKRGVKSQTGKKTTQRRRQPKANTEGSASDGIDNPGFNKNESNNEQKATPRKKKRVPRSKSPTAAGYSSTHSLQSGRSLPLSGDVSLI